MIRFHSSPVVTTLSPTRHHFRLPNDTPREIKETLNASYKEDEFGRSINQYTVKEEIGKGSYGMVRVAIDENTKSKYAIKEYSKQRLKKLNRAELMLLRRKALRGGASSEQVELSNPINLIRREVAIMKKLDHPNIVSLVEVLDDPHGDSLYVILEWCEKGVIMPTTINDASPYSEEQCRLFFRDMILGVEYLHSQGIIHRDIKADNVLVSEDDVVKIVDFGVSEIFEKDNDSIKKTVGSPAYMAPELVALLTSSTKSQLAICAAVDRVASKPVSGRAADIWSMGVTLYFMLYGRLPFQSNTVTGLYDEIMYSEPEFEQETCRELVDLLLRVLEKDPQKRIRMSGLREHSWVTRGGEDLLLSVEENTADCITPVTEEDLQSAIELIEGRMDLDLAAAKLRKLHGWRGSLGRSRDPSRSPSASVAEPTASEERYAYLKLTRALNEIITNDQAKIAALNNDVDENRRESSVSPQPSVQRRPSRTRTRQFMGLEMTAFRSKSLDTSDRL
jgi:[calcium/calmodulin-dependent protein kinase] kinase